MEIGGFFSFEDVTPTQEDFLSSLCPNPGAQAFLMSGRCAIYFCLQDLMLTDKRRTVYLPAYTCETVSGCFVKAGYTIFYYDVDEHLTPLFDPALIPALSLILICGYYGCSTFDVDFVRKCRAAGVVVMQDITQTAFSSNGVWGESDYIVGSLRKWMGVPSGGLAIKREGSFSVSPLPPNRQHLDLRNRAMELGRAYRRSGDVALNQQSFQLFWDAEWMLRDLFDFQAGDAKSIEIMRHYPVEEAVVRRRENYAYLIAQLPQDAPVKPFFTEIPADTCPMHFAFLCHHRAHLMEHLKQNGIAASIYWPVPPFIEIEHYPRAHFVYDHVMSICCDQRYGINDMQRVLDALAAYRSPEEK